MHSQAHGVACVQHCCEQNKAWKREGLSDFLDSFGSSVKAGCVTGDSNSITSFPWVRRRKYIGGCGSITAQNKDMKCFAMYFGCSSFVHIRQFNAVIYHISLPLLKQRLLYYFSLLRESYTTIRSMEWANQHGQIIHNKLQSPSDWISSMYLLLPELLATCRRE